MDSKMIPVDHTKRLPFEVLGKIFLLLGDTPKGQIEELKKCRQVSPRWYKVTQDLFRDEFSQELSTHFDGNYQSFASSRTFGQNLFGSYKFNFPMLKISNAEFYLMKRWLGNVTTENTVQFLELKDSFLPFNDMLQTLALFQNVKTIKVVQTSKDVNMAEKVCQFYEKEYIGHYRSVDLVRKAFKSKTPRVKYLKNLKSIKFEIVHPSVLNYFCWFIGAHTDCELENLSVKFDIYGLFKSAENDIKSIGGKMEIWIFEHLKYMSKSLKSLEFTVGTNVENYDAIPEIYSLDSVIKKVSCEITVSFFCSLRNGTEFQEIENLIIDVPYLIFPTNNLVTYFEDFIKKQQNLKNFYSSLYYGEWFENYNMKFGLDPETFKRFIKKNEGQNSAFGLHISTSWPTFLSQMTENLSVVHIKLDNQSTWSFSDDQVPIFPNCKEMEIKVHQVSQHVQLWPDFEVEEIFRKFPHLEILKIRGIEFGSDGVRYARISPQIDHDDFQFILQNYTNLKHLYVAHCFERYSISNLSFTGLPAGARVNYLNNPDLAVKPEELEGVPISNLKKLEVLVLKDSFGGIGHISDCSALFGFYQMPALKYLEIRDTKITKEGYSLIKEKSGSEYIETPYLGENEWSEYTRNTEPDWKVVQIEY